jgi:hypothetical protein
MESPPNDRLVIGVRAIARECFDDQLNDRQTYREIASGLYPTFKLRGKHATFFGAMREAIRLRGQVKQSGRDEG